MLSKTRTGIYGLLIFLSFSLSVCTALGQPAEPVFVQQITMTAGARNALPFWLSANEFGVIPSQKPSGNLRIKYTYPIERGETVSFKLGADAIGRAADQPTLFFQQLYGELKWGPFLFRAGRKEETAGNVHPDLSQGSMVLSANAAPVTGISVSWPEFVTIPGTGTFLAVKGSLKHGWVDGYRIATDPWLHAKSFYIRLGKDEWPVHGYAGLLHHAMWGGRHRNPEIGDLPSSFNDYLRVFFFRGASRDASVPGEQSNALGNSLGVYDFSLIYQASRFKLLAYRQFYLEDTVSTRFRNPWDGLWGLGLDFPGRPALIEAVLWEHINTKRQSSKSFELPGTDNYYNHYIYASGWTHRGRTLGTPLILMRKGQVGVYDNILLAHHFGLRGSFGAATTFRLLLTYTRNYGANSIFESIASGFTMENARFERALDQFYAGLGLAHAISGEGGFSIFARLAYDWGDLLPDNNFGFTLGIEHIGGF